MMNSYKMDVLERQSLSEVKMDRGSPICERVSEKIVEYFKNNVPQRQIAKALLISSSTVHNFKRFRETGEISVLKGRGWRPLLDALIRHCITHWHDSAIDISKWAQEYFQKPLSVNTVRRHLQMPNKALSCKKEPYVNMVQKRRHVLWAKAHLKWTVFKVEKCSMVRRVQMWHSCGKLRTPCPPGQRGWRPSSVLSAFN